MIKRLLHILTFGASKSLSHPRLLLVLVIAVVFPIALLFLTKQFLAIGIENFETLQRSRVGMLHDSTHVVIDSSRTDAALLQAYIEEVAAENRDITKFRIAQLEGTDIIVSAALNEARIDQLVVDEESYRSALLTGGEPITFEFLYSGVRYWQTFSTLTDESGTTWFILTEQSFESFENIVQNREFTAYVLLAVVYVFLLGLAYWQLRDIDYHARYDAITKKLEERNQFTNVIAHELRTPLTAIRGYASLIEEESGVSADTKTHAERIRISSERQLHLVNDFLEVARIQAGTFKIERKDIDLQKVIKKITNELAELVKEKGLSLTTEFPKEAAIINSDAARIQQILANVISNSVKYTKRGTVSIVVMPTNDGYEIRVKDTGVGISATDQKKLFAPFYRVQNKDTKKITGTGLGMWITKQLIEHLGGTIGIESIKDVGTNVVITFPKQVTT